MDAYLPRGLVLDLLLCEHLLVEDLHCIEGACHAAADFVDVGRRSLPERLSNDFVVLGNE